MNRIFSGSIFTSFAAVLMAGSLAAPAWAVDDPDAPAAPTAAEAEKKGKDEKQDAKKDSLANRKIAGRATRVAFLDYGPPAAWKGLVGDMVGVTISAKAFSDVIPLLKEDKTDVVVIRVNSGGGYGLEAERLQSTFQNELEKEFRTVVWAHWAMSAAAMGPWTIDEWYMESGGRVGSCTSWSGNGVATRGMGLVQILEKMRNASMLGGHDPKIMRSMQIMEPLSVNIDENNNVEYFQDATSGKLLINPEGRVLMLNAVDAQRIKFSRGIADNVPELMKAMNISEYEIVGEKATKTIQDFMKRAHKIDTNVGELAAKYRLSLEAALSLRGENNREVRNVEVGKCRSALAELKKQIKVNPNFRFHLAGGFGVDELTDEWMEEQERLLKRLVQDR